MTIESLVPRLAAACLLAAALLLAPARAMGQAGSFTDQRQWPDTPAAKRAKEMLDILSAGDRERAKAMVQDQFAPQFRDMVPMDQHLAMYDQQWASSRGYDFFAVRTYDPPRPETVCVAIVKNRLTEAWQGLVIEVEPEPPHRVVGMQLNPARPPKDAPAETGPLTAGDMAKQLDAFIDRLAKADAFSGTVLIAKDGRVVYTKAAGEASKEYHAPVKLDTKFNLGSMNKMFTGVAVAQLVEQGKVSWNDPISKWVDESWLPKDVTDQIQVRHLLTHTSGLGSYFNEEYDRSSRLLFRRVEDYKPLIKDDRPRFTPGSQWAYSNTGMLLAGVVIEGASGQDYFEYIREHVYAPAGMTSSDSYEMDRFPENLAIGYSREPGPGGKPVWVNNLYKHVLRGGPAGGGFSTVEDLLRFATALRSGKLVKPETVEMLLSPKPEIASPEYGYGFFIRQSPAGRIAGHSGGFPGINSDLAMHLDSGWTVAVMSNYDMGAQPVMTKIGGLLSRVK